MNHLAAAHRGSSPGLTMQMSTHLLEPALIMSREMETKTVHCTVSTHTHTHTRTSLRDTVTDEREKENSM